MGVSCSSREQVAAITAVTMAPKIAVVPFLLFNCGVADRTGKRPLETYEYLFCKLDFFTCTVDFK